MPTEFWLTFAEAQKRFNLAHTDSANVYSCVLLPTPIQGMVSIPSAWPAEDRHPCLVSLTTTGGTPLPLNGYGEKRAGRLGLVALLEAAITGTRIPTA